MILLLLSWLATSAWAAVETPPNPAATGSGLQMHELLQLRDPFRPKSFSNLFGEDRKPSLELYPTESFRLVGVITGPNRARAVLMDPTGKSHFVTVNTKIGTRNGIIRAIQEDKLLVRERIANVFGTLEDLDTEILLHEPPGKGKSTFVGSRRGNFKPLGLGTAGGTGAGAGGGGGGQGRGGGGGGGGQGRGGGGGGGGQGRGGGGGGGQGQSQGQ